MVRIDGGSASRGFIGQPNGGGSSELLRNRKFLQLMREFDVRNVTPREITHLFPILLPAPELKAVDNRLTIEPGSAYNAGRFHGQSVNIRIFSEGGYESSISPQITGPSRPGEEVSLRDRIAAAIVKSYSPAVQNAVDQKGGFLVGLYSLASGKVGIEATNHNFLEPPSQTGLKRVDIANELRALGIDPTRPFAINDRWFILSDGRLVHHRT